MIAGRRLGEWVLLGAGAGACSLALGALGLPAHSVMGATIVGIAAALRFPGRLQIGARGARVAQAVIGIALGGTVTTRTLPRLEALWLPVVLITLGTLLLAIGLGLLLRLLTRLDAATAVLACVPGGAVGLVVMARETGADDRVVAISQYLRVLVILLATPLLATHLTTGHEAAGIVSHVKPDGPAAAVGALVLAIAGTLLGRRVRLPVPSLLGPMLLSAAAAILVPALPIHAPAPVVEVALAMVGLDVGLRFTSDAVRLLRRLMPAIGLCIAVLLTVSFGMAAALTATTSVSLLDAYLATTPGGLSVVAATAYGTDADTALVTAIQIVRLIVMLVAAPVLVRLVVRAKAEPSSA